MASFRRSRCPLSLPFPPSAFPGEGEGLIISVTLDDPASEPARQAVLGMIERAVAAVPVQVSFPIDVTFPGESEPDLVDEWVARNTKPFYSRD